MEQADRVTTYQAILVEGVRELLRACDNERVRAYARTALGIALMGVLIAAALAIRVLVYVRL